MTALMFQSSEPFPTTRVNAHEAPWRLLVAVSGWPPLASIHLDTGQCAALEGDSVQSDLACNPPLLPSRKRKSIQRWDTGCTITLSAIKATIGNCSYLHEDASREPTSQRVGMPSPLPIRTTYKVWRKQGDCGPQRKSGG